MLQNTETAAALTGYTPTEEDLRSLEEWFAAYDGLASSPTPENIEHMADMAVFPLNLVTDGSDGDGRTAQWDRQRYTGTMNAVMGGGGDEEVRFESARTPFLLSPCLAVVFTDSVMTAAGGEEHRMRYADILVRRGGVWRFQTMVQGGWAGMLEERRD
ncbi:nuclear transport factor 2 family protein [Streptomyces radiopugnans]|uniref:nuclear transport factor 2 family protein n=1 Tax=Streptomyces radiopugnans TaxID=403935 RepID=UPI003F1CE08B